MLTIQEPTATENKTRGSALITRPLETGYSFHTKISHLTFHCDKLFGDLSLAEVVGFSVQGL
jgi:hypothetical protein